MLSPLLNREISATWASEGDGKDFEIWHFLIKFLAKNVVFLVSSE